MNQCITILNETYKKINDGINSFASRINTSKETRTPMGAGAVEQKITAAFPVTISELPPMKKVTLCLRPKKFL